MTLRRRVSITPITALLALSLSAAPAVAAFPVQGTSDKAIEAEIDFARGLARDWAFVDLAQGVLDDVSESRPSERMAEEVDLVRCELFAIGAKQMDDPAEANALFEQGYTALQDYIASNPDARNRGEAEASLVELSADYAASIDAALEQAAGDEADALRERKTSLMEAAIGRTETLIEELTNLDEPTGEEQFRRWNLMLRRGDLYAEMSKTLGGDAFYSEQAIGAYEELSLDAGFGTEFDLRANVGLGTVEEARGDLEAARDYYMGMIEQVLPPDPRVREDLLGWSEVPRDIREKRFNYVELGIPGVQRTSRALGEYDVALEYGLFLYNLYREEGFDLSILGHEALVEVARTLVEAGGFVGGDLGAGEGKYYGTEEAMKAEVSRREQRSAVEFALQLVNQVAEETPVAATKIKAGRLLEEINTRPDVEISASQLLEAAKAKRLAEEYDAALNGYYAVLSRMDTMEEVDRKPFGAEVYSGIGACLRAQDRMWEASMAYLEAVENWRDPNWDLRNARGLKASLTTYARAMGLEEEADVRRLMTQADNWIIEFADDGGDVVGILYRQAMTAFERENYDDALDKFREIEPGQAPYDPAQVMIGRTLLESGKVGDAVTHWSWYVDEYSEDPANQPESPSLIDARQEGTARATYYIAKVLHSVATKRFKDSEGEDATRFQAVVDRIAGFAEEFRGKDKIVPVVDSMLVDSYAKLGMAMEAAEVVARMQANYPDNRFTGAASIDLYKTYDAKRDRLMAEAEKDQEAIDGLTRNMAETLSASNGIEASPSYSNLNTEAQLWMDLGEWEKARSAYERVVNKFQGDETYGERVVKFATVNLAEALLELGEPNEAKALLEPHVFGDSPTLTTTRPIILTANAMLGQVVGSGTQVKQTPGAGGTDEQFDYITKRLNAIENSLDKWSCEWYEAKFTSAYAYYVWGQRDDRKRQFATDILDNIVTFALGNTQFTQVDEKCVEDKTDARTARRLGGGVLASRFRWLYGKTR